MAARAGDCEGDNIPCVDSAAFRGWAMRRGHRRRFARGEGREGHRGRTSFARSINRAPRTDKINDSRPPAQRKRRQIEPFQGQGCGRFGDGRGDDDAPTMWLDSVDACEDTDLSMALVQEPEEEVGEECGGFLLAEPQLAWMRDKEGPGAVVSAATAARAPREATPWQRAQAQQRRTEQLYGTHLAVLRKWSGMTLAFGRIEKQSRKARAEKDRAALLAAPRKPRVKKYRPPPQLPGPSVAIQGRPPSESRHERLLKLATPCGSGLPACWDPVVAQHAKVLKPGCEEYGAVTDYFLHTLMQPAQVLQLSRLQNREVYRNFSRATGLGTPTLMFHGCRSEANEANILSNGFQVSRCVSGGSNFGTWFAYGAAYSNGGYVLTKTNGERHIFICLVSDRYVRLDNATMRVVGQDFAYPLWLLSYKLPPPPPRPVAPVAPLVLLAPRVVGGKQQERDARRTFFVVRGGKWVAEAPVDERRRR